MSSYTKPALVIGLNIEDIKNKSVDDLEELCSMIYAFNTGKENICFSFFNQSNEYDFEDAVFGLNIISDTANFKSIDLGIPFDQEKIKSLSKHFKDKIGLEPKFLATFDIY